MSLSLVLLGLIWAISVGSLIVVVWTLSEWALAMWEDDTKTRRFAALSSPLLVLQFLKSRWRAMAFVFQGPAIIQAAYEQVINT